MIEWFDNVDLYKVDIERTITIKYKRVEVYENVKVPKVG